jgi:hypothetical protein
LIYLGRIQSQDTCTSGTIKEHRSQNPVLLKSQRNQTSHETDKSTERDSLRSVQVLLDANLIRQNNILDSLGFLESVKFEIV